MVLKRRASLYHRKKLKRISESFLDTACQVIGDYYGIGIESSDLEKCLLQYEDCRAIRSELRINSPSDTSCREWMISEICEYIGVNYWPCYYMEAVS